MKLRNILLAALAALACTAAFAVPARPGAFSYTQPDGSVVRLERHGDEFFHWTTLAGTSQVVILGDDGFWHPASLDPTVRKAARQSRLAANRQRTARPRTHNSDPMTHGERHIPVLLASFSDVDFTISDPAVKFTALLNEKGYSAGGGTGSVQDYYVDNSHGAFTPVFDVYGPVTLPNTMAYYGKNQNNNDIRPEEAVVDAAKALDDVIDFSQYDYDNDGQVDMILFYYAGYNEAEGGPASSIWPHQWSIPGNVVLDGKSLGKYFCTSELKGGSGSNMCGIGTTCHEFGHSLGLPDFYDTDYEDNGEAGALYFFSTMCSGSYNNEGCTPPYFNSEERIILGWMTDDDVPALPNGEISFASVQNDIAYRTYTDMEGEYFLYECRDRSGWDSYIPEGLVVYHVDKSTRMAGPRTAAQQWEYWGYYNAINAYGDHPCFYVIPAANPSSLHYSGSYLSEWVFPGSKDVSSYTPVDWDGNETGVTLSNISYSDGKVSLTSVYSTSREIVGKVTGQNGKPVSGVYIVLSEPAPAAPMLRRAPRIRLYECVTDSDGLFTLTLDGYEGDKAHLSFSKEGYLTTGLDVELARRKTQVSVVLRKEGEGIVTEYSYYDPTDDMYVFGDGVSNSLMASIRIPAESLPENGGRVTSVSFRPVFTAKAYYIIVDSGNQRLLTYEAPGVASTANPQTDVTVDLSEVSADFPTGQDLYVGIAVEEADAPTTPDDYTGYLFMITLNTENCYISPFDMVSSQWEATSYCLVLSARIEAAGSGNEPPVVDEWSFAKMGFNAISDPGNGSYAAGESFPLTLDLVEGVTATAETWTYDGKDVTGAKSVSLTAGEHTLIAKVSLSDGSKETLQLQLKVN